MSERKTWSGSMVNQPVVFPETEEFLQRLERMAARPDFHTVDLSGGPNRLLEKLGTTVEMGRNVRPSETSELASALITLIEDGGWEWEWSVAPGSAAPVGRKVWDQLARFRTWTEVLERTLKARGRDASLADLASRYQLVTPVSGAVVLESKQQFEAAGFEQVDPSSTPNIPGVPEPGVGILALLGSLLFLRRSRPLKSVAS